MKHFLLCALCALALPAVLSAYQSEVEYTGNLETELAADRPVAAFALKDAKPEDKSKLPALAGDETVSVGEMRFSSKQKKTATVFLVEIPGDRPTPCVYTDANMDGKITADEKFFFSEVADGRGKSQEAVIRFSLAGGPFKYYPVRIKYITGAGRKERVLVQSMASYARGKVDIAGRKTLVQYSVNTSTGQVNTKSGQIGIDSDGDGKVDTGMVSPEFAFARNETIVFRAGDRFVSTKSIDDTGKIIMQDHPASDYTRIEMRVGAEVPDFTFTDFEGKTRRLSEFRGKHVLMDFWGTWCGPCVGEIPHLKEAYARYRSRGFEILGMDQDESVEEVKKFLAEKKITWTQATTESIKDLIEKRFRIVAYPTTILLDPQGKIVSLGGGGLPLRGKELLATLDKVLPR